MITIDAVLLEVSGLEPAALERWIDEGWVRPERRGGAVLFQEIDVARCRLILELREAMEVNDAAMPVVLGLLDRLHRTRHQMRRLAVALEAARGAPAGDGPAGRDGADRG